MHVHDKKATRLQNVTDELAASFAWLGTNRLIFTGTPDGAAVSSGDVFVADEMPAPVILKTYSLKDGTITPLSSNPDVITIWAPSPDGKYVLYKAAPDPASFHMPEFVQVQEPCELRASPSGLISQLLGHLVGQWECSVSRAEWIDREAGLKLCEHCYGRG